MSEQRTKMLNEYVPTVGVCAHCRETKELFRDSLCSRCIEAVRARAQTAERLTPAKETK